MVRLPAFFHVVGDLVVLFGDDLELPLFECRYTWLDVSASTLRLAIQVGIALYLGKLVLKSRPRSMNKPKHRLEVDIRSRAKKYEARIEVHQSLSIESHPMTGKQQARS